SLDEMMNATMIVLRGEVVIANQYKKKAWKRITKKKTKNKAKITKPGTEWKSCEGQSQIKAKDQKSQSQSQLNKLTVKPEP
ncbi:hypothetical protein Tco_0498272, partial [Tanacetum coccineum]